MPPETVPIETLLWFVTKVTPPLGVTTMLCMGWFMVQQKRQSLMKRLCHFENNKF
jgi:hypothetical protein